MQPTDLFSSDVVAAVMRHMNNDHEADCLLICRGLGGQPNAESAVMSGMDESGIWFTAKVGGREVPIHLPWSSPLTERTRIRMEVTRMYREACAALGIAVPATGEDAGAAHS